MAPRQSDYVIGHTPTEQLRLIRQARILAPATERFFFARRESHRECAFSISAAGWAT